MVNKIWWNIKIWVFNELWIKAESMPLCCVCNNEEGRLSSSVLLFHGLFEVVQLFQRVSVFLTAPPAGTFDALKM